MGHKVVDTNADKPDFNIQGWCQNTKRTDHTKLKAYVDGLDDAALHHVKSDARAAATANPDGDKAGFYLDQALACGERITKNNKTKTKK